MSNVRKNFCILIFSYGRPLFLKNNTWKQLDLGQSKVPRYIVCSTDDKSIPEYKSMYGDDKVVVFDKEEFEKRGLIETVDNVKPTKLNRKTTLWVRNAQFDVARKLGYRYFLALDDDYDDFSYRFKQQRENAELCLGWGKIVDKLDEIFEEYLKLLDSAPFLCTVAFSQNGDYLGGVTNDMTNRQFKFKAMNAFFCDTNKEYRYYGRMNDDVGSYLINNPRGFMSLTLFGVSLKQKPTQSVDGGVTDMYKMFGTWTKSFYSVIINPSATKISSMGDSNIRIHHFIKNEYLNPKILSSSVAKGKYLDYNEVMKIDPYNEKSKIDFTDKSCEIIEECSFDKTIDNFF